MTHKHTEIGFDDLYRSASLARDGYKPNTRGLDCSCKFCKEITRIDRLDIISSIALVAIMAGMLWGLSL